MPANPSLVLAVTPGDPEGIGPEIVWKTLRAGTLPEGVTLLCVGAKEPFLRLGAHVTELSLKAASLPLPATETRGSPHVLLLPAPVEAPGKKFLPGFQSGWSIETATRLVRSGVAGALVTGPISKDRLQRGGYRYPGHTEFLAKLCKSRSVTMMLANDHLRVSLVTVHVSLKDVPKTLTRAKIRTTVLQTIEGLRSLWGIARPRIAVAGLNPHAGEGGLFGDEESRLIEPELKALRKSLGQSAELHGPLPADTLFAKHISLPFKNRFDAVVCMYHDQALIPVKLLDFPHTVNLTLGLPMIRTSVDHGVGFDIAGKGKADPSSFQSALSLAAHLVRNRIGGKNGS